MFDMLALVLGWTVALFVGLFGAVILWKVVTNQIDISRLISEPDGSGASLSRFQFLIFTFVIALGLFWVIVRQEGFPEEIPEGIFILLGISGGSYVVSKSIQTHMKAPPPAAPPAGGSGTPGSPPAVPPAGGSDSALSALKL